MKRHRPITLLAVLGLAISLVRPCLARTTALEPRAASNDTLPKPISVTPAQNWEGIDGSWNTLAVRVGTPAQYAQALVSTASQQTWVVHSLACEVNATTADNQTVTSVDNQCVTSRGGTFNVSQSSSWDEIGFYQLWLEKNMGLNGNGEYGYDCVGLGYPGEESAFLPNTTVGTLITESFWLGHFGINPKPTNFTVFSDPSPSYLTYLFEDKKIPSLAWGYTAGAPYRFDRILSSLTLGGYDTGRFVPNDLTFGFAPNNERDVVVGVVGLHASTASQANTNLLNRDPFTMYIDSTLAELYLPLEVCTAFEDLFGLQYDNATDLYLVDNAMHQKLLAENPNITFTLGQKADADSTVDIVLPYAAMDLQATTPYRGLLNNSRYFPIRRAEKESQFVLGRTFLQEAYLIVDWERQNFSVSQVNWDTVGHGEIVSIYSPDYADHFSHGASISSGAIAGVAIGGVFVLLLIVVGLWWWFWRRGPRSNAAKSGTAFVHEDDPAAFKGLSSAESYELPSSPVREEEGTKVFPKAELPADSKLAHAACFGHDRLPSPTAEVENTERQIFEMPGDLPAATEAGGRMLSEKESMVVRERIYNGVDPHETPAVSPVTEEPTRRAAPVSPSEVALVNRRLPVAAPLPSITHLTPRLGDGASSLEANDTFFQPPPIRGPRDGASMEASDALSHRLPSPRIPRDGRFLGVDDNTLRCPVSPLDGPDTARRRFSYEE